MKKFLVRRTQMDERILLGSVYLTRVCKLEIWKCATMASGDIRLPPSLVGLLSVQKVGVNSWTIVSNAAAEV